MPTCRPCNRVGSTRLRLVKCCRTKVSYWCVPTRECYIRFALVKSCLAAVMLSRSVTRQVMMKKLAMVRTGMFSLRPSLMRMRCQNRCNRQTEILKVKRNRSGLKATGKTSCKRISTRSGSGGWKTGEREQLSSQSALSSGITLCQQEATIGFTRAGRTSSKKLKRRMAQVPTLLLPYLRD